MSRRNAWLMGLILSLVVGQTSSAEPATEFDPSVLAARGIDPQVAEYFRATPRFTRGRQRVLLQVNGTPVGQVMAAFDGDGQLCLDENLLKLGGIRSTLMLPENAELESCIGALDGLPGAQVRLNPGLQQVALLVPTEHLMTRGAQHRHWASGGAAGVFNYDALLVSSTYQGRSSQYRNLGTELGFNAGDWVVRSRQNYTSFQGVERFETLYTQASRTWERYQANVQLGQLNLQSPLFAGEPFSGFQIRPEQALQRDYPPGVGGGSRVEGVAYTSSRLEVRQSGVMIYTTVVPAGPFTLTDLPLISQHLDLDVSVVEEGGAQRHFRVLAADLRPAGVGAPPGYALAAGKVRRFSQDVRPAPSFLAASKDWQWRVGTQFNAGLMAADDYRAVGWGVQQAVARSSRLSVQQLRSRDPLGGQGQEVQASLSSAFSPSGSVSLSAVQRSGGFRTMADSGVQPSTAPAFSRAQHQWGVSFSYADRHWGAFSGALARYAANAGSQQTRLSASWSRMFEGANVSLSVQHEPGNNVERSANTALYATLSLPLGPSRSLSLYSRRDGTSGMRSGARYTEQLSDTLGYSVAGERSDLGASSFNGRVNALPRYTSVDLGYARSGFGASNSDLGLRGGLALHEGGLTPSPYPLRDTFGLLKAGDANGIKLSTPQGPVWTDAGGHAVAASLPAYQTSRLEIDTRSLPRHVGVLNGFQEVDAGRGAVPRLDFTLSSARGVVLHVRDADGAFVPRGVAVFDRHGEYLTSVVDAGLVYLADAPQPFELRLALPNDGTCLVALELPEPTEAAMPYDIVEAVCRTS